MTAICAYCGERVLVKEIVAHVEACPDRPLEMTVTAKGRRIAEGRRKH